MKYASFLPLSALTALALITILVNYNVIPPGAEILTLIRDSLDSGVYWIIFLIILLESIVYVGFYFPGQFFAVVLVVGANPSPFDIFMLTISMVIAATIGSIINYTLGWLSQSKKNNKAKTGIGEKTRQNATKEVVKDATKDATNSQQSEKTKISSLLLAMIHINSLAFFMFAQGTNRKPIKIVALAGLFNLPYYLLLIAGTAILSEQVMSMAENPIILVSVISIWLLVALVIDYRRHKTQQSQA